MIYFAKLLSICHEGYEECLSQSKVEFKKLVSEGAIAIPITHGEIDFFRPLVCGDELLIQLWPRQTSEFSFNISYHVLKEEEIVAKAMTKHIAINSQTRLKTPLPLMIIKWLHPENQ